MSTATYYEALCLLGTIRDRLSTLPAPGVTHDTIIDITIRDIDAALVDTGKCVDCGGVVPAAVLRCDECTKPF